MTQASISPFLASLTPQAPSSSFSFSSTALPPLSPPIPRPSSPFLTKCVTHRHLRLHNTSQPTHLYKESIPQVFPTRIHLQQMRIVFPFPLTCPRTLHISSVHLEVLRLMGRSVHFKRYSISTLRSLSLKTSRHPNVFYKDYV